MVIVPELGLSMFNTTLSDHVKPLYADFICTNNVITAEIISQKYFGKNVAP